MRKKAQAQQIFTWIIAIVMMSLLILFGYRSIVSLKDRGEQVKYLEFKNDLTSTFETTMDYGSERRVSLSAPSGYNEVCFVSFEGGIDLGLMDDYPLIKDSVEFQLGKEVTENVFLVESVAENSFKVDNLRVDGNFLCIEVRSGKINFRVAGFGRYSEIRGID